MLIAQIREKRPLKPKTFAIWLRYDSRSGTCVALQPRAPTEPRSHNMYKEFRELSRADAVHALYQDMAARHRARFRSIQVCPVALLDVLTRQIIRAAEIEKTSDVRRANIKQLLAPKLRFPLPHRLVKSRSLFTAKRPSTF